MKKLACSIMIALLMGLSVNTFAQKSVAILNTKTAKQVVDGRTAIITFQLTNVTDEISMNKFKDSFKASQGVQEVKASSEAGNIVTYSVKMTKQGAAQTLQAMFSSTGIESILIDGTSVDVRKLATHLKEKKAAK
jgi:hypothetical protein